MTDITKIRLFTDFWLAGRGLARGAPGAVNDCFISPSQHKKYITKYKTYLVTIDDEIIGWAVTQNNGALIHMLIAGTHRGKGIGTYLLDGINPPLIHSKSNQSSGNPTPFYLNHGYKKIGTKQSRSRLDIDKIKPDRAKIIDVLQKI